MSRVGSSTINLPDGVDLSIDGRMIKVTGQKGTLELKLSPRVKLDIENNTVVVTRTSGSLRAKSEHGLYRALVQNMVTGVSEGYEKKLELHGVGYKVNLNANTLVLNLGLSHEVKYELPEGVSASVDQNVISLTGIDKQQVGQAASEIRALKKPEPYKGKGIRYEGEYIIRKSGKAALGGKE